MTARKLHISPQLALPQDTVTSTMIVYGGKGMGKTNFGSVLAEECASSGLRFAIIDPMGVWWGLRHSADGKGPGIEVLILGGIHGDIPLEPTGAAVVADLVVDENANVIIDISRRPDGTMWSIADRVRFVRDYCKRIYQRQGEKRRPLLQGIDEAARFIPQIIRKDDSDVAACMGAIAVLVEEGRNVGVGVCLITQRSARLNKDVAELADCMVAFRTVGPNSRRAVLDWLGEHVDKSRIKDFDQQLRALPRGSALVVSPGWLEFEGIVPMRMRQTFDSSATPKVGQTVRASGPGAKPDLAKYQARMAATIEKAKAEDPKLLQQRIKQLEKELATESKRTARPAAAAVKLQTKVEVKRVEVPIIKDAQVKRFEQAIAQALRVLEGGDKAAGRLMEYAGIVRSATQVVATMAGELRTSIDQALKAARAEMIAPAPLFAKIERTPGTDPVPRRLQTSAVKLAPPPRPPAAIVDDGTALSTAQQAIINAAAFLESIGVTQPDAVQLALFAGQSGVGSYWRANIGRVRSRGLMQGTQLTAEGRRLAAPTSITTVDELHAHVMSKLLEGAAKKILPVLIACYPEALDAVELGRRAGVEPHGSYWRACIGRLRSLGLISKQWPVAALPVLFLEGAA